MENRLAHAVLWANKSTSKRPHSESNGVYLLECESFVKVGIASDIAKRLNQAQVSCPFEIKVLAFRRFNNSKIRERWIHNKLWKYHHRGEWFKVPDEVRQALVNYLSGTDGTLKL